MRCVFGTRHGGRYTPQAGWRKGWTMRIDDLLEMAARDLPEGWSVRIEVEHGAAWVKAIAPNGVEYDIDSDEPEIADMVRDAIEFATANV